VARRQFRSRRQRPLGTGWARLVETTFTTVPVSSKVLMATLSLDNPGLTETVIRSRGIISVITDTPLAAAPQVQLGAFGIVVINDLALAAGAASIPGPVTDQDDEGWFVWQPIGQAIDATGSTAVTAVSKEYHFDSKAARRIETGFGAALMVENASAADVMLVHLSISQLTKINT